MDLQYPIGKFQWGGVITDEQREQLIDQIEQAPAQLRKALAGLTEEQVDTPYRPERLDGEASGPSPPRQPHECLRALQACLNGGRADHQTV